MTINLDNQLFTQIAIVVLILYNGWQVYSKHKESLMTSSAQFGAGNITNHIISVADKGKPFHISDGRRTITLLKVKGKKNIKIKEKNK